MKRNVELNAQNTKILVCCHKACTLPPDEEGLLLPIHCGAALSDVELKMQRDDEVLGQPCDNISLKNGIYNELTGTYWAWKNIKKLYPDLEYIGLCHYRRYFNFAKKGPFWHQEARNISESRVKELDCGLGALKKLMQSCDVILPVPVHMPISCSRTAFLLGNNLENRIIEAVILKLHPDYRDAIIRVYYKSFELPFKNMFVMRWELFEQYAKWLFGIFFEVEKLIKFAPYANEKQNRTFAYTGEHLLPLFCIHNRLSITSRQLWFVSEAKNSGVHKLLFRYSLNKLRFVLNMFRVNIFPPHGVIQMISQGESAEAMFKRVGVWDAIEQLGPVD